MENKKNWIQSAKKNGSIKKGGLHESLGIPSGEKIPVKKIRQAASSKSKKTRAQAVLALTFQKLRLKKSRGKK